MSTQLNEHPAAQLANDITITFEDLIEWLQNQTTPPSIEDITARLAQVQITPADLQPYLGFKEGNYWRHRVCRNSAAEMLVICWRQGQKTPIHDHNGSHGVVRVQQGLMWETMFTYDDEKGLQYKTGRECPTGEVTGAAEPDIHQLGNPDVSGQDLITIHVYAPPLGVLKTYKVGSANVDLYTPNDFPTD
ncbi:MAG TPA: cysteine dioxygenase family protein [Pyrinomonadaceae bacterium]